MEDVWKPFRKLVEDVASLQPNILVFIDVSIHRIAIAAIQLLRDDEFQDENFISHVEWLVTTYDPMFSETQERPFYSIRSASKNLAEIAYAFFVGGRIEAAAAIIRLIIRVGVRAAKRESSWRESAIAAQNVCILASAINEPALSHLAIKELRRDFVPLYRAREMNEYARLEHVLSTDHVTRRTRHPLESRIFGELINSVDLSIYRHITEAVLAAS